MDADTHFWLSIASSILYYTIYPLLILGTAVVYLVRIVASPFIYLAFITQEVILLPVRFLAKFEASKLYKFPPGQLLTPTAHMVLPWHCRLDWRLLWARAAPFRPNTDTLDSGSQIYS